MYQLIAGVLKGMGVVEMAGSIVLWIVRYMEDPNGEFGFGHF